MRVWLDQIYNARTITMTLGQDKVKIFFPIGVLRLGCCRTPSGTLISRTAEGVFNRRCKSIDVPKLTLIKIEHDSSIYADEMASVLALMPQQCVHSLRL